MGNLRDTAAGTGARREGGVRKEGRKKSWQGNGSDLSRPLSSSHTGPRAKMGGPMP